MLKISYLIPFDIFYRNLYLVMSMSRHIYNLTGVPNLFNRRDNRIRNYVPGRILRIY